MAYDACFFAVRVEHLAQREEATRRAKRLATFYAPLGARRAQLRWAEDLRLAYGVVRFDDADADLDAPVVWGAPPPAELAAPAALLGAGDVQLRRHDGAGSVLAVAPGRGRLVAAACPLYPLLFTAGAGGFAAWSSHAVAAAWLGTGHAAVDPEAIPELVASELVCGDRALVRDVRLLDVATVVDFTPAGARTRSFWPARERWALVPEGRAADDAGAALVASLARRIAAEPVGLGLTAGYDSRVVAVALREAGVPFTAITAETDDADVAGAEEVAAGLGLRHERRAVRWPAGDEAVASARTHVRFSDGAGRLPLAVDGAGGAEVRTFVTGAGGDVARALLYRWVARSYPRPSRGRVKQVLDEATTTDRISAEAQAVAARRRDDWLAPADEAGALGWRFLDIVYAENRSRRLYRANAAPTGDEIVLAYATPDIQRALVSLPVEDKLGAGFHRRFLALRAPQLAPPPPAAQRRGVPAPARRLASTVRTARGRRGTPQPVPAGRPLPAGPMRDWLSAAVADRLLVDTLGRAWSEDLLRRLGEGEPAAADEALLAANPVALAEALKDL